MVWITEWSQHSNSTVEVVILDEELKALTCAASMAMKTIEDEWNLNDPYVKDNALFISDQFAALNWRDGLRFFNECEEHKAHPHHLKVYQREPDNRIWPIRLMRPLRDFDLESFVKGSDPPPKG